MYAYVSIIYLYVCIYAYVSHMNASLNKNMPPFLANCLIIKKHDGFILILQAIKRTKEMRNKEINSFSFIYEKT